MRQFVKWGLCIVGALLVLTVVSVILFVSLGPKMIGCDYFRHDLGTSRLGDKVTAEEETCSGFGASVFMTISLAEAHGGNHGTIFSYEPYLGPTFPGDFSPRATWIDDTTVVIHVGRLDSIRVQHPALGRDKVHYDIGAVSSR